MGRVCKPPFTPASISELKEEVIEIARSYGLELHRSGEDRQNITMDFQFMDLVLRLAHDPEIGTVAYAQGLRVGPGTRMPRIPAQYRPKRRLRLPEQMDPLEYLDEHPNCENIWRRNYTTLAPLEEKVPDVLHDQASTGQITELSELEAKKQNPSLVIASLSANRKDKPDGQITARVLFDGTHGLEVNKKTRVPICAALGRLTQYMAGTSATTWHVPVADDFLLESSGREYRFAIMSFFVFPVLAQNPQWKYAGLGRLRTSLGNKQSRHPSTTSRVVCALGN